MGLIILNKAYFIMEEEGISFKESGQFKRVKFSESLESCWKDSDPQSNLKNAFEKTVGDCFSLSYF